MAFKAKQKGDNYEREIVAALKAMGEDAQRVPLSGAAGGEFSGDVQWLANHSSGQKVKRLIEAKNYKDANGNKAQLNMLRYTQFFVCGDRLATDFQGFYELFCLNKKLPANLPWLPSTKFIDENISGNSFFMGKSLGSHTLVIFNSILSEKTEIVGGEEVKRTFGLYPLDVQLTPERSKDSTPTLTAFVSRMASPPCS